MRTECGWKADSHLCVREKKGEQVSLSTYCGNQREGADLGRCCYTDTHPRAGKQLSRQLLRFEGWCFPRSAAGTSFEHFMKMCRELTVCQAFYRCWGNSGEPDRPITDAPAFNVVVKQATTKQGNVCCQGGREGPRWSGVRESHLS